MVSSLAALGALAVACTGGDDLGSEGPCGFSGREGPCAVDAAIVADTSAPPPDSTAPTDAAAPTMVEGWAKIVPGGNTACSDGSEYSFYMRKGTVNRVAVLFEGGGACWSHGVCSYPDITFTPQIRASSLPWTGYGEKVASIPGIFNQTRAESPLKDWNILFVPYCTGDIHWGTQDKTYSDEGVAPLTIRHRGAINATAALNYLYANQAAPEKVFVSGESAGGYGAAMWAPYIRNHYGAGTKVYQLSDSSAGVLADGFFATLQSAWNFQPTLPGFVPAFSDPTQVKVLADVFNGISAYGATTTPKLSMAMFNTSYDETQLRFFAIQQTGATPQLWNTKMREQVASIQAASPSFKSFTAAGNVHVILGRSAFYNDKTDGVSVRDWVSNMVNDVALNNIDCSTTTAGCGAP